MGESQQGEAGRQWRRRRLVDLAALVIIGAGVKLMASILVPVMLAALITVLTAPAVDWLAARRLPRALAVVVVVLVMIGVFGTLGVVIGGSIDALYTELPRYRARLLEWIREGVAWWSVHVRPIEVRDVYEVFDPGAVVNWVSEAVTSVAVFISDLVLVQLIVAFMLFESRSLRRKLGTIFHVEGGEEAEDVLHKTAVEVQKYLMVKTCTSLATGLILTVWLVILGVDFALLWGVLAFLLNFIPTVGSILAVFPPLVVAMVMQGPGTALAVMSGYLVVNFAIGNVLEPRIMGRALGLSPVVVLISILLFGWLLGPLGAILSVPLTMVFKIGLGNHEELNWVASLLRAPLPDEVSAEPTEPLPSDPDLEKARASKVSAAEAP